LLALSVGEAYTDLLKGGALESTETGTFAQPWARTSGCLSDHVALFFKTTLPVAGVHYLSALALANYRANGGGQGSVGGVSLPMTAGRLDWVAAATQLLS